MTARMARRACTLMVSLAAVLVLSSGIPPLRRPVGGRGVASPMKNRIMFPGDSVPESFGRFYFLLSDALSGKGRVRILHLGDSHVQAGYFTGRLREDLLSQGYDIDAGLGLVFPYRILGTNNPSYYKSSFSGRWKGRRSSLPGEKASLGLMGLAAWVAEGDTASFTIDTRIPSFCEHPFDRAVVWGYHSGGSLSLPFAEADGNVLLPSSEGDGVYEFLLEDGAGERFESTRITVTVPKGFVVTGVYLSRASQGLTLSGAGVNGASYLSLMNCEDLERDLVRYAPDAVILALGTNDAIGPAFDAAGYRERARKVVDMIRKANPQCAIIFVTPPDSFRKKTVSGKSVFTANTNGPAARNAVRSLCDELGGGLWDEFDIMGGLGSMQKWEASSLAAKDKVHFSAEGYCLLADLLFDALMTSLEKWEDGR